MGGSSLADAGTYSVYSVDWQVPNSPPIITGNAHVNLSGNDVNYGLSVGALAPGPTEYSSATAIGWVKWKVRWEGDTPTEAHPHSVLTNVQRKGGASAGCSSEAYGSGVSGASGYVMDLYYSASAACSGFDWDAEYVTTQAVLDTPSAENWTLVPGTTNTWEGSVVDLVQFQAQATAYGTMNGILVEAWAEIGVALDVTMRLTHIGGQRVNTDL